MDLHKTHAKRPGEDLFGFLWLIAAAVLFWQSSRIDGFSSLSSPGAFPIAVSGVMVVAATIVVIGNAKRRREAAGGGLLPSTVVLFTLMAAAYAFLLGPLGFLPSSFLFLVGGMKLLHRGGWGNTILIALVALVLIYVVFRLVFQVALPEGIMPEREIMAVIGRFGGAGA